jgi:NhaP-type Na+/H+ or K+/H+ antiporter
MTSKGRAGAIAYWTLTVALIVFGTLGLISIGFPFLLLGLMLAIVSQRRHETGVVAAGVAAIVGFMVGYILVAPLGCTTGANSVDPVEHTVCTNILGIDYSGTGGYQPNFLPGLIAGLVVAVLFGLGARWLARRIAARHDAPPAVPA